MKQILKDEDLKEKNKDLYELLNDFKEELKECNGKEEKHQLYLTYLDEFKQIVRELKEDDYIYKYSVDAVNWVKTRLMELYTGYKLQDTKKKQIKKEIKDEFDPNLIKDTAMTVTVQCYIIDKDKILIQDRVSDIWHGLAVPGGHVKFNESAEEACIREVKEETGLDVSNLELFGTNQYTSEEEGESIALLYKTSTFSGELKGSDEGQVEWLKIDEVLKSDNCADGFKELLKKCCKTSTNDSKYTFIKIKGGK